ncbi:MAG: WD40 repeat domain-containing protein [Chloroflexota bacterium]
MHDPRKRRSTRFLTFLLFTLFVVAIIVNAHPATILAQSATTTPTETITYTPSPYTPTITLTPSSTPTPLPTLAALLPNREVITAANASQLGKYREWQAQDEYVTGIAFIPHSTRLVSTGLQFVHPEHPTPIRMWDIQESGITQIENFFEDIPHYLLYDIHNLSLSPDGTRIVATANGIQVWEADSGRLIGRVLQSGGDVASLDASNQTLFVGGVNFVGDAGKMIGMWQIAEYIPANGPDAPPLPTEYVFNPQGGLVQTFPIGETVTHLLYDDDTRQLFALTISGRLLIYKFRDQYNYDLMVVPQASASLSDQIPPPADSLHNMTINRVDHVIAYSDRNHDVVVYDYVKNEVVGRYPLGRLTSCLNYSPDGRLLLMTDWDFEIKLQLFDTTTQKLVAEIVTGQTILTCTFSWDGKFIATGDVEGKIVLWGVPSKS